jgi:hypothetical protein
MLGCIILLNYWHAYNEDFAKKEDLKHDLVENPIPAIGSSIIVIRRKTPDHDPLLKLWPRRRHGLCAFILQTIRSELLVWTLQLILGQFSMIVNYNIMK